MYYITYFYIIVSGQGEESPGQEVQRIQKARGNYIIINCTVLYYTILYCIVMYTTVHGTILLHYYNILYYTIQYYNILYYTIQYHNSTV